MPEVRQGIEEALTSLEGNTLPLVRKARPRARNVSRKGLTGQWAERLGTLLEADGCVRSRTGAGA